MTRRSASALVLVLIMLISLVVGSVAFAGGSRQEYAETDRWECGYGDAADEFGLSVPTGDGEYVAPMSLALGAGGTIYVADTAKQRLALLENGEITGAIDTPGSVPVDVISTGNGLSYLDAVRVGVVALDAKGNEIARQTLGDSVRTAASGRISVCGETVFAQTGSGESHPVVVSGAKTMGLDEHEQVDRAVRGRYAGDSLYDPYWADGGRIVRYAGDGSEELVVRLHEQDIMTVDVVGEDDTGAFYAVLEIGVDGGVRVECRKYSADGRLMAQFEMPGERMMATHSTVVAGDGTVYRMVADRDQVTIVRYAAEGGDVR